MPIRDPPCLDSIAQPSVWARAVTSPDSELTIMTLQSMLTAKEAADFLNVSLTWMYRDAPKLGLTGYKFGRGRNAKLRFKYSEVIKWLEQQKIH
ncbi:helix-turn-helix domain-containing protein [Streptomyces sp. NPDC048637]|uniref:helix-turn-helix domain-containing protein n=1 Tax=Streptomyces sp. NPDC048637 TaxID=3155636 RepID=UPI00341E2078